MESAGKSEAIRWGMYLANAQASAPPYANPWIVRHCDDVAGTSGTALSSK